MPPSFIMRGTMKGHFYNPRAMENDRIRKTKGVAPALRQKPPLAYGKAEIFMGETITLFDVYLPDFR
jgi:hypothetical protein